MEIKQIYNWSCTQGGILSTKIWNIYMDDLLFLLEKENYIPHTYADDLPVNFVLIVEETLKS